MKHFIWMACILLMAACSTGDEEKLLTEKEVEFKEDYVLEEDGLHREYYGSNDQLKVEGINTPQGKRHGVWTHYFPDGKPQSVVEYKNGIRDGYTIVYHSNGSIYYSGEYRNDEMVGTWSYYDVQTGKKNQVKELGYPDQKKK